MAMTLVRSSWTGTKGVADSGLPDDWDGALAIVSKFTSKKDPIVLYTPKVVEQAWAWLLQTFGEEEEIQYSRFSIAEVVKFWLES